MYEKLMVFNQSLMLLIASGLIVMLLQVDNAKRLNELETRQTNTLTYLEQRVNVEASKLASLSVQVTDRLDVIETRQGIRQ